MFFTPQEMDYLEGSPFKNDIIVQINTATDLFNAMCIEIPEFKQFTSRDFIEAITIVQSRGFTVKIGDQEKCCLVPYVDMLNHKTPV